MEKQKELILYALVQAVVLSVINNLKRHRVKCCTVKNKWRDLYKIWVGDH